MRDTSSKLHSANRGGVRIVYICVFRGLSRAFILSVSATDIKMIVLLCLCAIAGYASGGVSVAWPGATFLRTVIPPHTKTVAYSTTQYINSLPTSPYSFGISPQIAYHLPTFSAFSPLQSAYYPVAGPSYFPPNNVFYPVNSLAPAAPELPVASAPSFPTPQPGDSDTSVVDSSDYPSGQQPQAPAAPEQQQPASPQFPQTNLPSFEDFIQKPDAPASPQNPQSPQGYPQAPQFPSGIPQIPQQGFPQYPESPAFAPQPTSPPSSFPSGDREDKGLNDEDTISVESA